jgi:AraC-like DNA-binding protein
MSEFGMRFERAYFAVLYITKKSGGDGLADCVRRVIPKPVTGYATGSDSPDVAVAVLNFDDRDAFPAQMRQLHKELCDSLAAPVAVGVGNVYAKLSDIPNSYIEARYANDYRFVRGIDSIIFAGEVMEASSEMNAYPHADLEMLKLWIHQGDADAVERMLLELLDYIKASGIPMHEARMLCYDIVGIVTKAISALGIADKVEASAITYTTKLIEYNTVDELTAAVRNVCFNICEFIKEDKLNKTSQLDNIKACVQASCMDVNFSVQALADSLNMGMANLSQYFKKKTGETLVDYVTELRMERAKELLRLQKYKLDDVAGMTGYMNVSSFIRRFKQYTGVTPGQYAREG